jgi:hypothetical protein
MNTLPIDLINLIWEVSDTTKGFVSFLSTTTTLDALKSKFVYDKIYTEYKRGYTKSIRYFSNIHFKLRIQEARTLQNLPKNIKEIVVDTVFDKELFYFPEGIVSIVMLRPIPLMEHFFPNTLRKLKLENFYNAPLKKGTLPCGLEHLTFGTRFNQTLKKWDIPERVTYLNLGWNYNMPLLPYESIPDSVRVLKFGKVFNQELYPGSLPFSVEILKLGYEFNNEIRKDVLPLNLKEIYFSTLFNQLLEPGVLPLGLTFIKFGSYFNQPILPGVIPNTVKKVIFGENFNQPLLINSIPEGVQWIEFGFNFTQSLEGLLPSTIRYIYVPNEL